MPLPPVKPTTPYWIAGDTLAAGARGFVPLTEGSGTPAELRTAAAGTFTTAGSGSTTPAWGSDAQGPYLNFDDGSATGTTSPFQELHFTNLGVPTTALQAGVFFALITPSANLYSNIEPLVTVGASSTNLEASLVMNMGYIGWWNGGALNGPTPPLQTTAGNLTALIWEWDNASNSNYTATVYDYVTGTTKTGTGNIGNNWAYSGSGTRDLVLCCRSGTSNYGFRGKLRLAGYSLTTWTSGQKAAFLADPFEVARATLVASPSSAAAAGSGVSFSLTGNSAFYTPGNPGSPTFTLDATGSSGTAKVSQVVGSTTAATVVANTGAAGSFTITDGRATATITVSATPATAVSLTGPTTSTTNAASTAYTASINGTSAGVTITPASTGPGDTITPASLSLSSGTQSGTFTVTAATSGARTISVTNSGSLPNPSAITLTATAATLTAGTLTAGTQKLTSLAVAEATPAAGGQGAYAYSWSLGTTATAAFGTALSGKTASTLSLTGLARRTPYWLIRRVTDGVGGTADSLPVAAATLPTLNIAYLRWGQSITASEPNVGTYVTDSLGDLAPNFVEVNSGVSGSAIAQWQSGQTYYTNAVTAANSALSGKTLDRIVVRLEFGVNDRDKTTSVFIAGIQALVASLLANPFAQSSTPVVVYLLPPVPCQVYTAGERDQLRQFMVALRALHNGTTTFYMGDEVYLRFVGRPDLYVDGVHPTSAAGSGQTQTGYQILAKTEADSFVRTWLNEGAADLSASASYTAAANVRLNTDRGDGTLGTLVVPAASAVLTGTTFDATTAGTVTLPSAGNVRATVTFGPGSSTTGTYDPVAGNYTDPGAAHVATGTTYQFAGQQVTGTLTGGGGVSGQLDPDGLDAVEIVAGLNARQALNLILASVVPGRKGVDNQGVHRWYEYGSTSTVRVMMTPGEEGANGQYNFTVVATPPE